MRQFLADYFGNGVRADVPSIPHHRAWPFGLVGASSSLGSHQGEKRISPSPARPSPTCRHSTRASSSRCLRVEVNPKDEYWVAPDKLE